MIDQPTPDAEARATLIEMMRKQSVAIYIAVEESVADDIAGTLRQAAALLAAEGWRFIYCDSCKEIRPLVRATMPADGVNTHAAQDLLCGECRLIVATLHESDSLPTEVPDEG